jgi:CBS domain-containing protein
MTRAGVHRVLVLDGDRLVGILSAVDIVRAVGQGLVL